MRHWRGKDFDFDLTLSTSSIENARLPLESPAPNWEYKAPKTTILRVCAEKLLEDYFNLTLKLTPAVFLGTTKFTDVRSDLLLFQNKRSTGKLFSFCSQALTTFNTMFERA